MVRLDRLMGSQCSLSYGEAKELPRTGAQPLLYRRNMTCAVMSHCICHLLGIQYDAFDVMSRAMAVGGKLLPKAYQPMTAKSGAVKGCNHGLLGLDYQSNGNSGAQRLGHSISP